MTERERMLLRIACSYMLSNLDDVIELFKAEDDDDEHVIDYNGEIVPSPTEDELDMLMRTLQ